MTKSDKNRICLNRIANTPIHMLKQQAGSQGSDWSHEMGLPHYMSVYICLSLCVWCKVLPVVLCMNSAFKGVARWLENKPVMNGRVIKIQRPYDRVDNTIHTVLH